MAITRTAPPRHCALVAITALVASTAPFAITALVALLPSRELHRHATVPWRDSKRTGAPVAITTLVAITVGSLPSLR